MLLALQMALAERTLRAAIAGLRNRDQGVQRIPAGDIDLVDAARNPDNFENSPISSPRCP